MASEETFTIYDFNLDQDLENWYVVDDVVMGGRSDGNLNINEAGNGLFYGDVSLDNYGGFSSIQYRFEQLQIQKYTTCKIRVKGDGKAYQFRMKTSRDDRHSYISHFETTGEWETIEIPMEKMYPSFRGRKLDMPNYPGEKLAQISFLIANKKAEAFELELDWIVLE